MTSTTHESGLRIGHAEVVAEVDADVDRDRWLELRRAGLGGSDAAAIVGLNRWTSPLQVWLDKTATGPTADIDNEAMFWGRTLEPIIANVTEARVGIELRRVPALLRHPEHPWMLASLDREGRHPEYGQAVVEVKTAGLHAAADWDDDQVPDPYVIQGMHYLAVTGYEWVLFVCLIGGQHLVFRWVRRDDELIAHLIAEEARFWELVETGQPPAPDGSRASTELLAHLWDVKAGAVLTVDPDEVEPLLAERARLKAAEYAAKEARQAVDNELKLTLGEHEAAVDATGRPLYTWKAHEVVRIDPDLARAELPAELLAKVTTTTTERRLHIPKRRTPTP